MTERIPDAHDLTKKLVGLKNNEFRDMVVESTLNNIPDEYMEELPPVVSFTDINTLFYSDYHALLEGKTGCLSFDTKIQTEFGKNTELNELYKKIESRPFRLYSMNFISKELDTDIARILNSGTKKMFKIKTKQGRTVKASKGHKFFVQRNGIIVEMETKDLKIGDKLFCFRRDGYTVK